MDDIYLGLQADNCFISETDYSLCAKMNDFSTINVRSIVYTLENDWINGIAGIKGKSIDAIQIKLGE